MKDYIKGCEFFRRWGFLLVFLHQLGNWEFAGTRAQLLLRKRSPSLAAFI